MPHSLVDVNEGHGVWMVSVLHRTGQTTLTGLGFVALFGGSFVWSVLEVELWVCLIPSCFVLLPLFI